MVAASTRIACKGMAGMVLYCTRYSALYARDASAAGPRFRPDFVLS